MVRMNTNVWEFLNRGNEVVNPNEAPPHWVSSFRSRLRSVGCTISPDSLFWKEIYAVAGWSPFQRSVYGGSFRGYGAGLQVFAVLEKHVVREKILDPLYFSYDAVRKFRKAVSEAINEGHVDGQWLAAVHESTMDAFRRTHIGCCAVIPRLLFNCEVQTRRDRLAGREQGCCSLQLGFDSRG